MCVICDDPVSGSHVADDISLGINDYFVKVQFLHFCRDRINVRFLIAAFARIPDDGTQECSHVCLIVLCSFFDLVKVHGFLSPFLIENIVIVSSSGAGPRRALVRAA